MEESGAALRASKRGKAHILALNCNVAASSVGDDSPTGAFTDKAKAPTATGNSTVPLSDNLSVGAVSIGSMNMVKIAAPPKSRRPMDSPFMQQRIRSYIILLTPGLAIVFFTCIAALCLTVGILLRNSAESIHTSSITYEGKYSSKSGCEVTNRGDSATCNVTIIADGDMKPPIYVYYGIDNFYQNNRKYFASRDSEQLLGNTIEAPDLCAGQSPCGLIANSTFNDTYTVVKVGNDTNVPDDYMVETGIAWKVDIEKRFKQPEGFWARPCVQGTISDPGTCLACLGYEVEEGCFTHLYQGSYYAVYYPDNENIKYLYEMFDFIDPVEGVQNEHFMVWMRVAGKKRFFKIYGIINTPIKNGDEVTFQINANFYVKSFEGSKELAISTLSPYGYVKKNNFIWILYILMGSMAIFMALVFLGMNCYYRRDFADTRYLDLRSMM